MIVTRPVDPWLTRRGADVRDAFAGELALPRLVPVCSYCPDAVEQTAAARAHGFEVTSATCAVHVAALLAQLAVREARR